MRINSVTTKEKKQDLWRKFLDWRVCTELKKGGSSPGSSLSFNPFKVTAKLPFLIPHQELTAHLLP